VEVNKIEEILYEAYDMGKYHEVIRLANKISKENPSIDLSDKLQLALKKIKKQKLILSFFLFFLFFLFWKLL